jgi:hypothetical protein
VQYTVIAGDAAGMDSTTPGFSNFLQQTQMKLGKWMNSDEPNDLFAPVRSLECPELWEGRESVDVQPTMRCHHFSYLSGVSGTRSADTVWKVLNDVL